jgi:hypothetical protein
VRIYNETNAALHDVSLSYQGGDRGAEQIVPGGIATSDIRSSGESSIALSYRDSQGASRKAAGLAFIESGYRGSLEIHVGDKGVRLVDRIHADGYPGPWVIPVRPTDRMKLVKPR